MIIMVRYMDVTKVEEKKDFKKIDKITRNFVIVSSVILGSIFLAACAYMLVLINDAKQESATQKNTETVQNMNLVSM